MTIRRATEADRPALVRMALQFIAASGYRALVVDPDPARLEDLATALLTAGVIFVAEPAGAAFGPCGMLAAEVFEHPMSGEVVGGEVAWWIDPPYRGGPSAVRLLDAAERWARQHGAVRFRMIAPAASAIGDLYRRRGYLEVETVFQRPLVAA